MLVKQEKGIDESSDWDFKLELDDEEMTETKIKTEDTSQDHEYNLELDPNPDISGVEFDEPINNETDPLKESWVNGKFVCVDCGMSFMWHSSLERHRGKKCVKKTNVEPKKVGRPAKSWK